MSWKEQKALRDAHANACLKRVFVIREEFDEPGSVIQTMSGTRYVIAKDGSRRRLDTNTNHESRVTKRPS